MAKETKLPEEIQDRIEQVILDNEDGKGDDPVTAEDITEDTCILNPDPNSLDRG